MEASELDGPGGLPPAFVDEMEPAPAGLDLSPVLPFFPFDGSLAQQLKTEEVALWNAAIMARQFPALQALPLARGHACSSGHGAGRPPGRHAQSSPETEPSPTGHVARYKWRRPEERRRYAVQAACLLHRGEGALDLGVARLLCCFQVGNQCLPWPPQVGRHNATEAGNSRGAPMFGLLQPQRPLMVADLPLPWSALPAVSSPWQGNSERRQFRVRH
ncbi:hypothetical protein GGTG_02799 [Gaeumannomyces tritici R3-111a-1]|uniref:Uncharacterized protein n=1 Tax=Gaeumannomyces tritici (strain R3-111a-1) TaxID=644352 RepID=J3NNE3_GAET3|nr:hypothetical protein GGTG_02799 [Gaeumannomyces tritici R3-111a-1]EJT77695.1 hypothetical protein GGTG_02799 [Gaeumannomyces tritici R3-111a-1]